MTDYTAVITGGNQGIGRRLAEMMLDKGWKVVSISRKEPDWERAGFSSVQADLLDIESTKDAANKIATDYGVTHLVHNAGMIWPNLIEDATPEDLTGLTQLHLGSALTLLQGFLPHMKDQQFGRVLFNGSRAAQGAKTRTAYGASKAGMIGMARTWALELAPHGITVNVVAPGPIQTENFWGIIPKGSDQESDLGKRLPVGRLGTVDDVANAFMFFADPSAGFVTGQTLYVCGGASIGGVPL